DRRGSFSRVLTGTHYRCRWIIVTLFLLSGCHQEVSEVCGDLAWPFLVGKWEPAESMKGLRAPTTEGLTLLLYLVGEAIKNGQKGSWKIITCEGPTVVIDLPRRMQTDSCELRVEGMVQTDPPMVQLAEADRARGLLTCTGKSFKVVRTETRGWVPAALATAAAKERERKVLFKNETGFKRWWLEYVHSLRDG